MKDHLRLLAGKVQYLGPTSLLELDVTNVSIHSGGPDHVFVKIMLRRRCLFHLATTYFPTLCLFLISEVLLFINEEHFEATIMVSLTAMLVMYTLHQSILSQLPKTSYMKMIDIWLLCGLTIPFLVFILEVTSEMIRHNKKQQQRKRARLVKGLRTLIPNKVKDNFYTHHVNSSTSQHQQDKRSISFVTNSVSVVADGETINGTNNGEPTNKVFKVNRGTQADKKDYKKPEISAAASAEDSGEIKFTLLEEIVLTYKKVTIPLMTAAFIFGYMVAAVRNYVY